MGRSSRERGSLEREVLAALGAAPGPMTVLEVLADLDSDLAYTTVMTTLSRLHAKNAVSREQHGRAYHYSLPGGPAAAQASMTAHHMHRLLDRGDDRRRVLSRFVDDLEPADETLLRRLLAAPPNRRRKPR